MVNIRTMTYVYRGTGWKVQQHSLDGWWGGRVGIRNVHTMSYITHFIQVFKKDWQKYWYVLQCSYKWLTQTPRICLHTRLDLWVSTVYWFILILITIQVTDSTPSSDTYPDTDHALAYSANLSWYNDIKFVVSEDWICNLTSTRDSTIPIDTLI